MPPKIEPRYCNRCCKKFTCKSPYDYHILHVANNYKCVLNDKGVLNNNELCK